jgi:hypothetical protein
VVLLLPFTSDPLSFCRGRPALAVEELSWTSSAPLSLFSKQNIVYNILRHEACDIKTFLTTTSYQAENINAQKICRASAREPNFTSV